MRQLSIYILLLCPLVTQALESTCYGTSSNGRLENGIKLPTQGENFVSYSTTAGLLGRTYVHSKVKTIILSAYAELETKMPDKVFKYAETGFQQGGQFKPHRTHRNGLSVDFMVPVVNKSGTSVHLASHYFNKLGYSIEFDKKGNYNDYKIDFEAMAAHIVGLHKASVKHGGDIRRIIFDPKLQPFLFKTRYGGYLKREIKFLKKEPGSGMTSTTM